VLPSLLTLMLAAGAATAPAPEVSATPAPPTDRGRLARFGVIGVLGGEVVQPLSHGTTRGGVRVGVGPRFSLRPRTDEAHQVVPSLGLVFGVSGIARRPAFFSELRLELGLASSPTITQTNFNLYGLAGIESDGRAIPYVGLGVGWNWLPDNPRWLIAPIAIGGGLGLLGGLPLLQLSGLVLATPLLAVPLALGVMLGGALLGVLLDGFITAGRFELRYFPQALQVGRPQETPLGPTEFPRAVAVLFGVGL
jgi:hypothetical protein